jgi:ankyrin repeat protein
VTQRLIAAGAPVNIKEASGINLLHWAVIANRPALIPILAAAGAPVNATDENDFTPLMYAATIDFGNPAAVTVLLKAGADSRIRNGEGRTAPQQARHYHHDRLAAAFH